MRRKSIRIGKDVLARKFAKLHKLDKEIITLDSHLRKRGFRKQRGKANFWGIRNTYEDKGNKASFTLTVQDYIKQKSKDAAAIGQMTVSASDRTVVYTFDLIAPKGDFKRAREYHVGENLKVSETNSWWSCVLLHLARSLGSSVNMCYSECSKIASAGGIFTWCLFLPCFTTCIGTIAPFLFPNVSACCACNCQWWCAWATGCCRQ